MTENPLWPSFPDRFDQNEHGGQSETATSILREISTEVVDRCAIRLDNAFSTRRFRKCAPAPPCCPCSPSSPRSYGRRRARSPPCRRRGSGTRTGGKTPSRCRISIRRESKYPRVFRLESPGLQGFCSMPTTTFPLDQSGNPYCERTISAARAKSMESLSGIIGLSMSPRLKRATCSLTFWCLQLHSPKAQCWRA